MRKVLFLCVLLGGLFFSFHAFAQEKISSFHATLQIQADSSVQVTERVLYDFGSEQKHGIYRTIPIRYKVRGGNYSLRISDVTVLDEHDQPRSFEVSRQGSDINIKIGDAEVLVSGGQVYIISYKVRRAINFFSDHDELYWNVTGNEWTAPIAGAIAEVILPQGTPLDQIQTLCFSGEVGSISSCPGQLEARNLAIGEGMTMVVSMPKDVVSEPSIWQKSLDSFRDNGILLLPVAVLLFLVYFWWTRGRDPVGKKVIIAQYEPPNDLSPIEVGTIIDEQVNSKDVSAEIVNLAVKGFIKIKEVKKKGLIFSNQDYLFEKLRSQDELESDFQKKLMIGLFGYDSEEILLSQLKDKFFPYLEQVRNQVYEGLVLKGYFEKNPKKVRALWLVAGLIFIVLGFPLVNSFGVIGIVSAAISGFMIIGFSFLMPKKTLKGVYAKEHILGLKRYLTVAEKERLKFHNAPEKKPETFESLLPFAMVLGVEQAWAKQFVGIYNSPPSWYEGPRGTFNAIIFANALNSFGSSAATTISSRPGGAAGGGSGLGGGGFSGGGFGGGGGGSW